MDTLVAEYDGFGLDLDEPAGIVEGGDDHAGGGRENRAEHLAVGAADFLDVLGPGMEDPSPDDVLGLCAELGQGLHDDHQTAAGLAIRVCRRL